MLDTGRTLQFYYIFCVCVFLPVYSKCSHHFYHRHTWIFGSFFKSILEEIMGFETHRIMTYLLVVAQALSLFKDACITKP